jgi:histidine ammonia-lyase
MTGDPMKKKLIIDGNHLTIEEVAEASRQLFSFEIDGGAKQNILKSQKWVEDIIAANKPVYGINTGFGYFSDRMIKSEDATKLSRNLILSHAVCTGPILAKEIVRAAMLVRANTLAKGYSGVRLQIVETLLEMLTKNITPIIPSQGSLGSSGDLGPLSHLALVFTTDEFDRVEDSGSAEFENEVISGKSAMTLAGIPRVRLGPKEGLALNNGATFSAAIAALAVFDVMQLLKTAEVTLALSLEAMLGSSIAFDARLHMVRGHLGQIEVAKNVRDLIQGSTFVNASDRIQDAYSLRCAPQVHGPVRDILGFAYKIITAEINAATDNPLLFGPNEAYSGGNFHGEPVGLVMDYLAIAVAEIGAISERRIFRLTDSKLNGNLPPMLVDNLEAAGLNSGMMMPQYTAASLVLENQTLATPDSIHSLPTSGEQEDHNANSMTAARHARQIINNVNHILAIEAYTAVRAIDLRRRQMTGLRLGMGTEKAYELIRDAVPYQPGDAWWGPEIEIVHSLISSGSLSEFVNE